MALAAATSGTSYARLGRALGVASTTVERFADGDERAALTLGDVLACADAGHREFARTLLASALAVVKADSPAPTPLPLERQARLVMRELGNFVGVLDEALADGVIDPGERRDLLRLARGLFARTSALRSNLETPATDDE